MRLGFGLPVAGGWATPQNMIAVAREAESLGYHSLWTVQRILYPSAPRNEYAGSPSGPWPAYFESVADGLVALGYVAAATSRIQLGTAVVNLPYYSPVLVGGYSPAAMRRAVSLADGYIGGNVPLAELVPVIERLRTAAREAGRDPDGVPIVARGAVSLRDRPTGPGRRPLFGSLDEVRDDVDRYRELGLTELFLDLNFDERVAAPGADPDAALGLARRLLAALAPSG